MNTNSSTTDNPVRPTKPSKPVRPVRTIRLGPVEASIWENQGTDGRPNHSVTFKRSYKDGDQWRDSDTYWADHLPLLAKAADLAHTAILTELRPSGNSNSPETTKS